MPCYRLGATHDAPPKRYSQTPASLVNLSRTHRLSLIGGLYLFDGDISWIA